MLTQAGTASPFTVTPPMRDGTQRHSGLPLLGTIWLVGVLLRLWLLSRGIPTLDSDEGTIGLMSRHMLHGEWSVFVWGQAYMGSLESLLIAPFLWLFGATPFTLRLAPLLVGTGFIISSYAIAAWLFSRRVALVAAALLAVGPPFFMVLSIRAFGGYVETLLFGNLLLLLALRGADPQWRTPRKIALLGLLAGIALWTDFLIGPFLIGVVAIFWWQRRLDMLRRNGIITITALLVGVSPVLIYEIVTGGGTARAISNATLTGTGPTPTTGATTSAATHAAHTMPLLLVHNPISEMLISLPIMVGGGLGGTQSYGFTADAYLQLARQRPGLYAVNLLLTIGAIALIVSAAIPLLRHWRVLWVNPRPITTPSRAQIRHYYEAAVVLIITCYAIVFLCYRDVNFAAPRYLLPLFAATPLIVGQADQLLARLMTAIAAKGWLQRTLMLRPKVLAVVPALALALVFLPVIVWNVVGTVTLTPLQTAARDHHAYWITGDDHALVQLLHAQHIHTFITNDYWESMRLTFEADEAATPVLAIPSRNLLGLNRYQPYVTRGLADPRPAYIEFAGSDDARYRLRQWQSGAFPGYSMQTIEQYLVLIPGN